jgi:AcrR family transcriptional regulator
MPRPTTRTAARARRRRAPGPGPVRERILDAALAVLREEGIQRLTQVRVARRAGVRQSHLTYYFPSRTDLLDATTARFVETLAAALGPEGRGKTAGGEAVLAHLARAVVDRDHMRMFVGAIVAADRDPDLRAILLRGTERMEAALAEALGGAGQRDRARAMLATLWGVGLYGFLMRPPARHDPTRTVLAWLELLRKEKAS